MTVRVSAVIPCFNRWSEVESLWSDVRSLNLESTRESDQPHWTIGLSVIVVDNGSTHLPPDLPASEGIKIEWVRLERNAGGAGGFNAGLSRAMSAPANASPDFLWLLDSDARVEPNCLLELISALRNHPGAGVAGPALIDPACGAVHELGGRIGRSDGRLGPARHGTAGLAEIFECDYAASCCALVRAEAARSAGLMPEVFLHGDDAAWCVRIRQRTGLVTIGVPRALAAHPRFDRFATGARYYVARNALLAGDTLDLTRAARAGRVFRECARAAILEWIDRPDLARLHVLGLADAAAGFSSGPAPRGTIEFAPHHRLDELPRKLADVESDVGVRKSLVVGVHPALRNAPALWRAISARLEESGLRADAEATTRRIPDIAFVPAGTPVHARRAVCHVVASAPADAAFFFAPARTIWGAPRRAMRAGFAAARCAISAARLIVAAPGACAARLVRPPRPSDQPQAPRLSLDVVLLSHNRLTTLKGTIARLLALPGMEESRICVVDNASTDYSADRIAAEFPGVRLIRLAENEGIAGFNHGVAGSLSDLVLVLDDDAWPDAEALEGAVQLLSERPDLGAVALHPRNPRTKTSEWRFAARQKQAGAAEYSDDRWPFMGCGNIVRTRLWRDVGGYEREFFLYRNDVDLALKILSLPQRPGVHFNSKWVVWHDSPAAVPGSPKSALWHRLATRNWLWVCRQHGTTGWALIGMLMGWLWSHRLAGSAWTGHVQTIKGLFEGALRSPQRRFQTDGKGEAFADLMRIRLGFRRGGASGLGPVR